MFGVCFLLLQGGAPLRSALAAPAIATSPSVPFPLIVVTAAAGGGLLLCLLLCGGLALLMRKRKKQRDVAAKPSRSTGTSVPRINREEGDGFEFHSNLAFGLGGTAPTSPDPKLPAPPPPPTRIALNALQFAATAGPFAASPSSRAPGRPQTLRQRRAVSTDASESLAFSAAVSSRKVFASLPVPPPTPRTRARAQLSLTALNKNKGTSGRIVVVQPKASVVVNPALALPPSTTVPPISVVSLVDGPRAENAATTVAGPDSVASSSSDDMKAAPVALSNYFVDEMPIAAVAVAATPLQPHSRSTSLADDSDNDDSAERKAGSGAASGPEFVWRANPLRDSRASAIHGPDQQWRSNPLRAPATVAADDSTVTGPNQRWRSNPLRAPAAVPAAASTITGSDQRWRANPLRAPVTVSSKSPPPRSDRRPISTAAPAPSPVASRVLTQPPPLPPVSAAGPSTEMQDNPMRVRAAAQAAAAPEAGFGDWRFNRLHASKTSTPSR
jgi:hypothetical protein